MCSDYPVIYNCVTFKMIIITSQNDCIVVQMKMIVFQVFTPKSVH